MCTHSVHTHSPGQRRAGRVPGILPRGPGRPCRTPIPVGLSPAEGSLALEYDDEPWAEGCVCLYVRVSVCTCACVCSCIHYMYTYDIRML